MLSNYRIFPDDWKLAKVTPIFKQDDRSDRENSLPISVIPAIAKVFKGIVYNQLSSYLSENNILSQYQSGFQSFQSTVTTLLEAPDNWAFNIDHGYVNGVKGNAYESNSSYLDNRMQKCAINGVLSQGTILGSLLFLLYIMTYPIAYQIRNQECMRMILI